MAATTAESTPLLRSQRSPSSQPRVQRTVTFSPTVSTSTSAVPGSSSNASNDRPSPPVLSSLNSKLRRRHSHGAPLVQSTPAPPKSGAQRTTKHAQKLKLLPNPDEGRDEQDEESGRDVYSQFTRIKDPMARRDAARLGKDDRKKLPRVTAYCTANAYKLDDLMKFLRGRGRVRGAAPKLFDECIYTPYRYAREPKQSISTFDDHGDAPSTHRERRHSDGAIEAGANIEATRDDLMSFDDGGKRDTPDRVTHPRTSEAVEDTEHAPELSVRDPDFDIQVHTPEVFLFNYGTVVIWGMTLKEEERFLKDISKFEQEKLAKDDVQAENFNFYYTTGYQARIYNDFISLREKRSYMTKLAISHALSQSVKVRTPSNPLIRWRRRSSSQLADFTVRRPRGQHD